ALETKNPTRGAARRPGLWRGDLQVEARHRAVGIATGHLARFEHAFGRQGSRHFFAVLRLPSLAPHAITPGAALGTHRDTSDVIRRLAREKWRGCRPFSRLYRASPAVTGRLTVESKVCPRSLPMVTERPSRLRAAVAPSATMATGFTSARSRSSQILQRSI